MSEFCLSRKQRVLRLAALGDVDNEREYVAIAVGLGRKGDSEQHRDPAPIESDQIGFAFVERFAMRKRDQCAEERTVALAQKLVDAVQKDGGSALDAHHLSAELGSRR